MTRRYFGTDGIRGVVGRDITPELVEQLGRAATIWAGGGAVLVGRDTRGSGPELEEALARGILSAGGDAVLAGVLPTPAVALFARDLGAVVSASHNPPEYNGVKLFDRDGAKLTDAAEEEIESFLDEPPIVTGIVERDDGVSERYLEHVLEHFGADLGGLRIAVDCANGAYSTIAPEAFRRLGADLTVDRRGARRDEHQRRAAARPTLARCADGYRRRVSTSASRSTATATGCSRSTPRARPSTVTRFSRSWPSTSASTSSRSRR